VVYSAAYLTSLAHQLLWFGLVVAVLAIAERRWPAGPPPALRDRGRNFLLVLVVALSLAAVSAALKFIPDAVVTRGLVGTVLGGWHPAGLWAFALATAVYAFVWDFFQYWAHRAQHVVPALWPAHALHHDDDRMNSTTSLRNTLWSGVLGLLLVQIPTLVVCGVDLLTIYGAYLLFATWGFINHANVRVSFGPLTPVISGPQLHRVHHGRSPEYHDCNFAAFFPLWDVVFRTYRAPARDEYPETGLTDRAPRPLGARQLVCDTLGLPTREPVEQAAPVPAGD
jgi:sterol desaturase/sphingolipid hydroxylase (fatty acid hydroxylase superfamily)